MSRTVMQQALDALVWASGSEDFAEGGVARKGALKLLFPAIDALHVDLAKTAALPDGWVVVPMRMTKPMEQVTEQEDWQWEDLLAAAEAITPEQYNSIADAPQPPAPAVDVESLRRLLLEMKIGAPNGHPFIDQLARAIGDKK